jgi:hypothetical protein
LLLGIAVVAGARAMCTTAAAGAKSVAPVIVSPAAGSMTASPTTQISLLGAAASSIHSIRVSGSRSGVHRGTFRSFVAARGKSFLPSQPFQPGETVTVSLGVPVVGAASGSYSFVVARRVRVTPPASTPDPHLVVPGVEHFVSAPSLDPPAVTVTKGAGLGDTDLLLSPKGSVGNAGPEIVDSSGALVWFDPLDKVRAFDLNEQQLGSKRVLTWWQGVIVAGHGVGADVIMNSSYHVVATINGGNGFQPDLHEFQLEASGIAYVTSYQAVKWNMAADGGAANGTVWDGIVQEIDVRTGLVMYEWHSLDHVAVSLSELAAGPSPNSILDYFHVNSIQLLGNGDLLISARNTSAIYEVSPEDGGAVVWELGGKNSSFAMGAGTVFWFQHDARELSSGVITLFDDEAAPAKAAESRAIELKIDPSSRTATLLQSYAPPSKLLAVALGSTQVLAGGNVFVSWGTTPVGSEYSSSGREIFNEQLPSGDDTYRIYRKSWSATPTTPPSVVLQHGAGGTAGDVSWNGSTAVARWLILSGASAGALHQSASVTKSSFESPFAVPAGARFVAVEAIDEAGKVLGTSATEPVP